MKKLLTSFLVCSLFSCGVSKQSKGPQIKMEIVSSVDQNNVWTQDTTYYLQKGATKEYYALGSNGVYQYLGATEGVNQDSLPLLVRESLDRWEDSIKHNKPKTKVLIKYQYTDSLTKESMKRDTTNMENKKKEGPIKR